MAQTKLGAKQEAGGSKESPASLLSQAILNGACAGKTVELPRGLGLAYVQLIGSAEAANIELQTIKKLQGEGVDGFDLSAFMQLIEGERALRTLAKAVRDPENHDQPFGTLQEWGMLDVDLVTACWHLYGDIAEELDPNMVEATPAQIVTIRAALEKKNPTLLRSFGTHLLVSFMLSTGGLPSTAHEPKLPSGAPFSDSST